MATTDSESRRRNQNAASVSDVLSDFRLDNKPGRLCVASSRDGNWFVFVDTITNKNYSYFKCFLWNQCSQTKVQLPCLPDKPESFLKCIVSVDINNSHNYTVRFFYKLDSRYIRFCNGWEDWRSGRYFPNTRQTFRSVVSCDNYGGISDYFCGVGGAGLLINCLGDVLESPSYLSTLYVRVLVVDYGKQRKDHCRLFLLERRTQTRAWEVWEVDFSRGKLVPVDNLAGKVIFLSGNYAAVCRSRILGNCICFTVDADKDKFYVFRLADKTTSIFPNQPHSKFSAWFLNPGDPGLRWLSFVEKDVENNGNPEEPEEKVAEVMPVYSQESIYFNLPDDILRLVAESLYSTMDYANFRMVCRKWREIARPIYWKHNFSNMESPWLMSFEETDACASFLDPTCNMRFYSTIKELSGCKIWYSKDGWLLVTRFPTVFFFEPFSKTKISVPDFPSPFSVDWMSFSSAPTSTDWIILSTLTPWNATHVTHIKSGDKNWSRRLYNVGTRLVHVCSPVFHNDRFYCLAHDRSLIIVSWEGTVIQFGRILTTNKPSCRFPLPQYLVSCDKELYLVVTGPSGKYATVYMLDDTADKWEQVEDVGNFSFFICDTSSFAVQTTKHGHINFPLFLENHHLSYKLDTSEFECSSNHAKTTVTNGSNKLIRRGTWIQPKVIRSYR